MSILYLRDITKQIIYTLQWILHPLNIIYIYLLLLYIDIIILYLRYVIPNSNIYIRSIKWM